MWSVSKDPSLDGCGARSEGRSRRGRGDGWKRARKGDEETGDLMRLERKTRECHAGTITAGIQEELEELEGGRWSNIKREGGR